MGDGAAPAAQQAEQTKPWWDTRLCLALVVVATMLPLLYPQMPPLVDLPGHVGQYRVELGLHHSAWLQRYFDFHWTVMGNLGVDLLIIPLAPLLGLEGAVKLIVLLIPPITAAGFLWVAKEVHGRVPPTAFFALPFIYSFPFMYGFVNYALSLGLTFLAFGLWIRLGREGRIGLRAALFAPISLIIFFCHAYGWALLGLMVFCAEFMRLRNLSRDWWRAAGGALLQVLVMTLPIIVLLVWTSGGGGMLSGDWFDWPAKWNGLRAVLRDRWAEFDLTSLELAGLAFVFALVSPRLRFSRCLAVPAAILAILFLLLPGFILDSAFADIRLLPVVIAVTFLAVGLRTPSDLRAGTLLAMVAIAFFSVRLVATTASMAMAADEQRLKLHALDHIPPGARVAALYVLPREEPWPLQRDAHLGAFVIVRRDGFTNDQVFSAHQKMLMLKDRNPAIFAADPSEIVRPGPLADTYPTLDQALASLPRDKFDYVWLINVASFDRHAAADLQPVWRGPDTILLRFLHGSAP